MTTLSKVFIVFNTVFVFCLSAGAESIGLSRSGGVFELPVKINDRITLDFVLDSGAAEISIPSDVVLTLIRTGTISQLDYMGTSTYILADGSKVTSPRVRLRRVQVGSIEITNVVASVTNSNGSLLLGQSFLSRLPSWKIDNAIPALVIGDSRDGKNGKASALPSASDFSTEAPICLPNCRALPSEKEIACLKACSNQ